MKTPEQGIKPAVRASCGFAVSPRVWIWLSVDFCLLMVFLLCIFSSRPIKMTAHLSPADLREVRSAVRKENLRKCASRFSKWVPLMIQEWVVNLPRPVKSIKDTTNTLHEINRQMLSSFAAAEPPTNPVVEAQLHKMEKRIRKQLDAGTNPAVEVWYADKMAHRGEAGYVLEKGPNGWKVTIELFR